MSKKLKKCPFCGGDDVGIIRRDEYGNYAVRCWDCGATGEPCDYESDAIEAWNTRVEE